MHVTMGPHNVHGHYGGVENVYGLQGGHEKHCINVTEVMRSNFISHRSINWTYTNITSKHVHAPEACLQSLEREY